MSGFMSLPFRMPTADPGLPEDVTTEDFGGLANFGWFTSLTGMLMGALGGFYSAKGQQGVLESQASSADFAADMASINARAAESDANAIQEAGRRQATGLALQQSRERAAAKVEQGASGTAMGSGSNAEALASQRFLAQLDAMTLDSNTVRATEAARTGAVDIRNQGNLARASAANLRGTARSIDPYAVGGASLLSGGGTLASQWLYNARYKRKY